MKFPSATRSYFVVERGRRQGGDRPSSVNQAQQHVIQPPSGDLIRPEGHFASSKAQTTIQS